MNEIGRAIEILEGRVSGEADDPSVRYRLAVLRLSEYVTARDPGLLADARRHLARAIELRPRYARAHAALGYAYDLMGGRTTEALACFREARRLGARDRVCDAYVITLLEAAGREDEALAEIESAAPRHGVDLPALKHDLAAARMPTDARTLLLNGFVYARNFFNSSMATEAERVLNALEPGRAGRAAAAERRRCREAQQDLAASFDASRVPAALRPLAAWAARYGIGDDDCRPFLLGLLPKNKRLTLARQVDGKAQAIHTWLDSFADAPMTAEASAFMYLALGLEELRRSG